MKKFLARVGGAAVRFYRRYPARANSYILSAIVGGAGAFGVVIDPQSAGHIIELVLPILVTGELTHHKVSPAKRSAR